MNKTGASEVHRFPPQISQIHTDSFIEKKIYGNLCNLWIKNTF